jgi:GWxTD domain-containing protein
LSKIQEIDLTMGILLLALVAAGIGQETSLEDIENNLDVYLNRWADEYVSYIITDSERRIFSSLPTADDKLVFIESFWKRRDPTPETPENEFRDQYAARFGYANARFRAGRPGWKTDRGRIYILLGPPSYIDRNPMGRTSTERPSEVWTYMSLNHPDLPSSLEVGFVDFFGTGDLEIVADLDAANLRNQGIAPAYSDLEYFGLRRSHPVEYGEDGVTRALDEGDLASERFDFIQDLRAAESPIEARPQPLSAIVGATASFATLPFDLTAQVFPSRIPIALAVRYDDLSALRRAGRDSFSLDVFAELRGSDGKVVDGLDRQLNFNLAPEEMASDRLRYLFALSAPAGSYELQFVVRDNVRQSVGTHEETVVVPGSTDALGVSSLIMADAVERRSSDDTKEEPFTFGEVRVAPNPARTFRRGEPMYVYFQAYGLGLDEGRNSVRVSYAFSSAGQPLWKPSQINLLPTEKTERGIFTSFDTARFPAGEYTLHVKVEDLVRRLESSREVGFLIQ